MHRLGAIEDRVGKWSGERVRDLRRGQAIPKNYLQGVAASWKELQSPQKKTATRIAWRLPSLTQTTALSVRCRTARSWRCCSSPEPGGEHGRPPHRERRQGRNANSRGSCNRR